MSPTHRRTDRSLSLYIYSIQCSLIQYAHVYATRALKSVPNTRSARKFRALNKHNARCFVVVGSRLEELLLRGNEIDDAEGVALAEAIEGNTVLCSLNLFDNKITDVG